MTDRQSGDDTEASADALPPEVGFDCLTATRRRGLIAALEGATDPVPLTDLADAVAEWETDGSGSPTADQRETVRCSLHHCHAPKLDDAGVVDHDPERGTVEPTGDFERLVALWRSTSETEKPLQRDANCL